MKDLENNKLVAAIVIAGLIALIAGKIADGLYHPVKEPEKRGFAVEVAETTNTAGQPKVEEPIDIAALMAAANVEKGAKVFKKCASCHTYNPGGAHLIGPNVSNIVNAKIAAKSGYSYSSALSEKGGNWTYEELFAFLKRPRDYAPGTKMTFAGFRKPEDIANVIKFLEAN